MLREQVSESVRIAKGMGFGDEPYLCQVEVLHGDRWEPVKWETFASEEERDARFEGLLAGFRNGSFGIYYDDRGFPYLAYIQQKSGDLYLLRVYEYFRRGGYRIFWAHREWLLPHSLRSAEWKAKYEAAQNSPEVQIANRIFCREVEDDRLFWELYVNENASASAEAL